MTDSAYPRTDFGADPRRGSPDFPALEAQVLDYWFARRHLPRHHRPPRRRPGVRVLRRAAVRQRTAALRSSAHRLRQGHRPAVPHDARLQGGAPLRLGHPRAARRTRGRAPAGHHRQVADRRHGDRRVQRRVPGVRAALHRRMAGVRDPPGPLGRLRQRLQDARPRLHGVGDLGVQAVVGQGPGLRGLPGVAVLLARRDPAVQSRTADGRRRLSEPPRPGADGGLQGRGRRAGRGLPAGVDDHTVDPAVEPGGRGQPGRDVRAGAGRGAALRAGSGAVGGLRPRAGRGARGAGHLQRGSDCWARATLPPFPYFMDTAKAFQVLPADFVTTEDGTGIVHMAPAYGEDDMAVSRGGRHRAGHPGRFQGPFRRHRAGLPGTARL